MWLIDRGVSLTTFSLMLCAAAAPLSKNGEKSRYAGFTVWRKTFFSLYSLWMKKLSVNLGVFSV